MNPTFYLLGLTTPQPETQVFLALLHVLIRRVVFLHDLKVLLQSVRQLMAASPVLVLAAFILLVEMEGVAAADKTDVAAADAPDERGGLGLEMLGVLD
jgi:hypothetical protein